MKKYYFVIAALAFMCSVSAVAQNAVHICGQDVATEKLFANDPAARAVADAKQQELLGQSRQNDRNTNTATYVIPVVFHIVHNYGSENITDAQVLDAMNVLNEDYSALNADTSLIQAPFDTLFEDADIEFRLAQIDPNGNCTNGIEHIASMETYIGNDGSKINGWPRDRYLNIWVTRETIFGVAAFSYSPAVVDPAPMAHLDGIVILNNYVGTIGTGSIGTKHTLTHEIGHWLGLQHLWGPGQPGITCGDDGIADTPVTKGFTSCTLSNPAVCNPPIQENVTNFMETSYCPLMFTQGQCNFMHAALNSGISQRSSLWTNSNLSATGVMNTLVVCAPHADFKAQNTMLCENANVTFTDLSWGSSATSWQWTISNVTTQTSAFQNPSFTNLTEIGAYDVTLIVANSTGSDTIIKNDYFYVTDDTAILNALYTEDFETPGVFSLGYIANDRYGNGSIFSQTLSIGNSGTGSAVLNSYGNNFEGDIDELITPSYDLSFINSMQISFVYAYATASAVNAQPSQKLKLYSSTNCGSTWIVRWTRSDSALVTAGYHSSNFVPSAGDWDTVIVSVPSSLAQPRVLFKFAFESPYDSAANNLYIDDIQILGANVGVAENTSASSFEVYPNPGDGNSTVVYTLQESAPVVIEVFDISGRLVSSSNQGEQGAGLYITPLSTAQSLAPGTYMVRVTIRETVSSKKFVVTE